MPQYYTKATNIDDDKSEFQTYEKIPGSPLDVPDSFSLYNSKDSDYATRTYKKDIPRPTEE